MATATNLDVRLDAAVDDVSVGVGNACRQRRAAGQVVLDARGDRGAGTIIRRYQKFLGQEVELASPHGLTRPILMDATVGQADGYRFIYVLPFTDTRLLIEDTYYADGPDRDADLLRGRIAEYASAQGWSIARLIREEGWDPADRAGRQAATDRRRQAAIDRVARRPLSSNDRLFVARRGIPCRPSGQPRCP